MTQITNKDFLGKLNKQVQIFKNEEAVDNIGNIKNNKSAIAKLWASVQVLEDSYWYNYGKENTSIKYKIITRMDENIKVGYIAHFSKVTAKINSVIHKESNLFTTEIIAVEMLEEIV